jgi:hypothetical protein
MLKYNINFHIVCCDFLVADGGDDLQIWRVAANILNKQSQTANKGWSSTLGVGRGAKTPNCKK